jgi:GNAT superfamily N-acetyltransferase
MDGPAPSEVQALMQYEQLPNIAWHALTGPQAACAAGGGGARRYAPGFSPIAAFADPADPDFAALDAASTPGEHIYCGGPLAHIPAHWRVDFDGTMHQLAWEAPPPAGPHGVPMVALGPAHVPRMLDLVERTKPGPFGPRTIELGDYLGVFDGERLLAMAGERMNAGTWREISGVCTDPSAQGRGLAKALMHALLRRALARGEAPFLHVMAANTGALALYERMGFRRVGTLPIRVLTRTG